MAVAVSAKRVLKVLLHAGASLTQTDCNKNNIIHNLVILLVYNPELESHVLKQYKFLVNYASHEQVRVILHHENKFGLRPLEFAAQHGLNGLLVTIMDTPGVYLYKEERKGLTLHKWYDITEYESCDGSCRSEKSPLWLMNFSDKNSISDEAFEVIFKKAFIQQWQNHKFITALPVIFIWFLLRAAFVSAYFVYDMDTSWYKDNITSCRMEGAVILSPTSKLALTIYLLVQAGITIMFDVIETIKMFTKSEWPVWHSIKGKKNILVQVHFYRYTNFTFSVLIAIVSPLLFFKAPDYNPDFLEIIRVFCPVVAMWSVLYFVQLLPCVGYFIITIVDMLKHLLNFSIVYTLLVFPFILSFLKYINANTLEGCIPEFSSFFRGSYSVFTIMLNMINLTSYKIRDNGYLLASHVLFTFAISIMLINFFIAVMSGSVNELFAYKKEALVIQRCTVAYIIEKRWKWLLKPYYRYMNKKNLHRDGDRILLFESKMDTSLRCSNDD